MEVWRRYAGIYAVAKRLYRTASFSNSRSSYRCSILGTVAGLPAGVRSWTVESLGDELGGDSAAATAVNEAGVAAGWYTDDDGYRRAFIAFPGEGEFPLGYLHPAGGGAAIAINNENVVTGQASIYTSSGVTRRRAFRWTAEAGLQNLGILGGGELDSSAGYDINDSGVIVGVSSINRFDEHAFRCLPGAAMQDLGTLGGPESSASGINGVGHIV